MANVKQGIINAAFDANDDNIMQTVEKNEQLSQKHKTFDRRVQIELGLFKNKYSEEVGDSNECDNKDSNILKDVNKKSNSNKQDKGITTNNKDNTNKGILLDGDKDVCCIHKVVDDNLIVEFKKKGEDIFGNIGFEDDNISEINIAHAKYGVEIKRGYIESSKDVDIDDDINAEVKNDGYNSSDNRLNIDVIDKVKTEFEYLDISLENEFTAPLDKVNTDFENLDISLENTFTAPLDKVVAELEKLRVDVSLEKEVKDVKIDNPESKKNSISINDKDSNLENNELLLKNCGKASAATDGEIQYRFTGAVFRSLNEKIHKRSWDRTSLRSVKQLDQLKESAPDLNRSQYSLVSCGELTAEAVQLWLSLPEEVKYDPALAPFRQLYEKEHGKVQKRNSSAPKRLPLVSSAPHLNNNLHVVSEDVFSTRKGIDGQFDTGNVRGIDVACQRKESKMSRARHYTKMTILLACWLFFTMIFLLYNEKEHLVRHSSLAPGEVKNYPLNVSTESLSVLIRLSGPFLSENNEARLNNSQLENANKMDVWLEKWTLGESGDILSVERGVPWSLILENETQLDFNEGEQRSHILRFSTESSLDQPSRTRRSMDKPESNQLQNKKSEIINNQSGNNQSRKNLLENTTINNLSPNSQTETTTVKNQSETTKEKNLSQNKDLENTTVDALYNLLQNYQSEITTVTNLSQNNNLKNTTFNNLTQNDQSEITTVTNLTQNNQSESATAKNQSENTTVFFKTSLNSSLPYTDSRQSKYAIAMKTNAAKITPFTITYTLNPLEISQGVIYAAILLCGLYVLIIFEIINRTMAAVLLSTTSLATLALVGERPSVEEVVSWLDVETLLLLFSMMLLVAIMAETGMFDYLAVYTFEKTKGKLWPLITLLSAITALLSTFLDNVTTVLLMTPVTIRLCEVMELDPIPILMSMVLFSNIGGTATPVGDPPNVIIASNKAVIQSGINFTNFTLHMSLGIILVALQTYFQLRFMFRDTNKLRLSVPRDIQARKPTASAPNSDKAQYPVKKSINQDVPSTDSDLSDQPSLNTASQQPIPSTSKDVTAQNPLSERTSDQEIAELRNQISIWKRAADSLPHLSKDQLIVHERLERKVRKLQAQLDAKEKESSRRAIPKDTFQSTLDELKGKYKIRDKALLIKATVAISFVVAVFFLHSIPELNRVSLGWTALLGAILLLLLADREDLEPVLHRVEWSTLLFFAALFVLMEALSKLGLIEFIGGITEAVILSVDESARLAVALLLLLWVSGITSAFVDNIPLTTMMVRVVTSLGSKPSLNLPMAPLIWALSFGACLGGNGTLIGASANVVCAGVAEQHGYKFTFVQFFKIGFPIMIGHLVVATVYLLVCHCVFTWH